VQAKSGVGLGSFRFCLGMVKWQSAKIISLIGKMFSFAVRFCGFKKYGLAVLNRSISN